MKSNLSIVPQSYIVLVEYGTLQRTTEKKFMEHIKPKSPTGIQRVDLAVNLIEI